MRIAVVTPGFSADCLETLEEIAGENADAVILARDVEHVEMLVGLHQSVDDLH